MHRCAELAGELDVEALEDEMPLRTMLMWGEYWTWQAGDAKPEASDTKAVIRDPKKMAAYLKSLYGGKG